MSLGDNKADLSRFLSEELAISDVPCNKVLITAGGFLEEDTVWCSKDSIETTTLCATHEEADTRIVLHAIHSQADTVVVSASDTDVLILHIAHRDKMTSTRVYMRSGTAKRRKYIPVHEIHNKLPQAVVKSLLPFHAVTGCDVTSQIEKRSKATTWKVFCKQPDLLASLGEMDITEEVHDQTEQFVCALYGLPDVMSCDKAREIRFLRWKAAESLPPTSDALHLHTLRSHFTTLIWKQAAEPAPILPNL